MSRRKKVRQFSPKFKLKAIERMLAGDSTSVLAREFKVVRKLLYYWKDAYISEGPEGLRKVGRPRRVCDLSHRFDKKQVLIGRRISMSESKNGKYFSRRASIQVFVN
jgi:hypothetical protein